MFINPYLFAILNLKNIVIKLKPVLFATVLQN